MTLVNVLYISFLCQKWSELILYIDNMMITQGVSLYRLCISDENKRKVYTRYGWLIESLDQAWLC